LKVTKNNIKLTAITISLFIMGSWLTPSITRLERLPKLKIPILAVLPNIVATTLEILAIKNVFLSACKSPGVWSEVNIDLYASKENPSLKENVAELLNENTIISNIGAYSNAKTSPR
jgi:hypothetical protein